MTSRHELTAEAVKHLYNAFYAGDDESCFDCPACGAEGEFVVIRSGQRGFQASPRHSGKCRVCGLDHTITRDNDPLRDVLPTSTDEAAAETLGTSVRSGTWHCPFDGTRLFNESEHHGRFIVTCPRCRVSTQGEI